jgi:4-hydroxythreonine-4-phosphate dehydrogenase
MGDPCGIGAEIIVAALKARGEFLDRCVVFGNVGLLAYYAEKIKAPFGVTGIAAAGDAKAGVLNVVDPYPVPRKDIAVGKVSVIGGECAFQYVKAAIDAAVAKTVTSVVTAPLNKEALHLADHNYAGHTEIFADFTSGEDYAMLLWSDTLKCIHATTHVSLRDACDLVTKERVAAVIRLAHSTLQKTGYANPRIAVAGLNPHAGENGIFGTEEVNEITPAIEKCAGEGINVVGPIAPDTVFLRASKGEFDIVVAMYHDQGHIPLKLLAFDSGVNITVGLDVIRTSVDHGTAFDIAGKLIARPDSLLKAIEIGEKL